MLKSILISMACLSGIDCLAQQDTFHLKRVYVKFNFFGIGPAAEVRVVNPLSIYIEAGVLPVLKIRKYGLSQQIRESSLYLDPYLKGKMRYFPNQRQRARGKTIEDYSGLFIGPYVLYQFGVHEDLVPLFLAGPIFGVQKKFKHAGFFFIELGAGYSSEPTNLDANFGFIVDLGLGITINK